MTYGKHFSAASTTQTQPLPGRADMVKNAAGGFVFNVTDLERVRRFLILGSEGGTYYASEATLTRENAETVVLALSAAGRAVIDMAVEVSDKGLAPKNDPAIFVLALASIDKNDDTRKYALAALPKICRIPTHLFTFAQYRQDIGGGWGSGMRRAISNWYLSQGPAELAVNALKYPSRNGWSHRDLFRLAHPVPVDAAQKAVFDAICEPEAGQPRLAPAQRDSKVQKARGVSQGWAALRANPVVDGWMSLREPDKAVVAPSIIRTARLQREMIPTELLKDPAVWDALLPNLGYTALIRNLGAMSKSGLLVPFSEASKYVQTKLADGAALQKARIHPFNVLLALKTYSAGHGFRGSSEWTVVPQVVDALDSAFDLSFHNVEPTGKRFILGLDVSGSMTAQIDNSPLSAAEAAAAFAMVTARTESEYMICGFAAQFRDLKITAKDSLDAVMKKAYGGAFGTTDCSVPLNWARQKKMAVDAVMVYTDNETWAGPVHASAALAAYRKELGLQTKLGMVAFTATAGTVADPTDPGSMNFVGLDASLPQAIAAFVQG